MIMRRWFAFVLDCFIGTIPFDIYFQVFKYRGADGEYTVSGSGGMLMFFVPIFIYVVLMESQYGWTLGKKLCKLKVIKTDGTPVSLADAAKRHVFDFIELVFVPFISLICVLTNKKRRRLGDLWAGTQVVDVELQTSPQLP